MEKHLVILKTGEKLVSLAAVAGDYEDWIREGMGLSASEVLVVDAAEEPLPPLQQVTAVVITGSGAMVTEQAEWMERCAVWLREAAKASIPLLGICFGHQLLAYALGGRVDNNPRGIEVGTAEIRLTPDAGKDPLFCSLPERFHAQLTHTQSVVALPPGAIRLAVSEMDPNQAFAWGANVWGIQFHPEFDEHIIRYYLDYYSDGLAAQGSSVEQLMKSVQSSLQSRELLRRFAMIVHNHADSM